MEFTLVYLDGKFYLKDANGKYHPFRFPVAAAGGGGRGRQGETGPTGATGATGDTGPTGPAGDCFVDGTGLEACQQENTVNPNDASGDHSLTINNGNKSSGVNSLAGGLQSESSRVSESARADGMFSTQGDAQSCQNHYKRITEDDTPLELFNSDNDIFNIKESSTVAFKIKVTGTGIQGSSFNAHIEGAVKNNLGTASIIGIPVITFYPDNDEIPVTNGWDVDVEIDGVGLAIIVTGDAGFSVLWVAELQSTEIVYTPS